MEMLACDALAMAAIALLSWIFIRRVVEQPLKELHAGTEKLTAGALGHPDRIHSNDEIGIWPTRSIS